MAVSQTLASLQAGAAEGRGDQAHQGGTPAEPPRALARLQATSSTSEIPAWRVSHFGGWAIVTTADSRTRRTAWGEGDVEAPLRSSRAAGSSIAANDVRHSAILCGAAAPLLLRDDCREFHSFVSHNKKSTFEILLKAFAGEGEIVRKEKKQKKKFSEPDFLRS